MIKGMMMTTRSAAIALVSAFTLAACSEDVSPIEIRAKSQRDPIFGIAVNFLEVTATSDLVSIEGAEINRGNCTITPTSLKGMPAELKFGQKFNIILMAGCDIREVSINTSSGSWDYTFE